MLVRELMSRHVTTIAPSNSCLDAVTRMHRMRIRHLPVVNQEGLLVGVVTDRDLRRHLFSPGVFKELGTNSVDILLKDAQIAQIMSTEVITVGPSDDVADAVRIMLEKRIGSLPVVQSGRIVGMLTETDMLRHIVRSDANCSLECADVIMSLR
jgi:acetoin utilization protein AcuB